MANPLKRPIYIWVRGREEPILGRLSGFSETELLLSTVAPCGRVTAIPLGEIERWSLAPLHVRLGPRQIVVAGEVLGACEDLELSIVEATPEELEKLRGAREIRLIKVDTDEEVCHGQG
ncbi:MAG: hypothetical protein ACOC58_00210 [Chloroflexota bacterium]